MINENNYEEIIRRSYNILLQLNDKSMDEIKLLLIMLFLEKSILVINGKYIPLQYSILEIYYLGYDKNIDYDIENNEFIGIEIIDKKQKEYFEKLNFNQLIKNPFFINDELLREEVYIYIYKLINNKSMLGGTQLNYKQRKIYEEQLYGVNSIHNFFGKRESKNKSVINNITNALINQFTRYKNVSKINVKERINLINNKLINNSKCIKNNCKSRLSPSLTNNKIADLLALFDSHRVINKLKSEKLINSNGKNRIFTFIKLLNNHNKLLRKSGIEEYFLYYLLKHSIINNDICIKIDNLFNKSLFVKNILLHITNPTNNFCIINDAEGYIKIKDNISNYTINQSYKNHIYRSINGELYNIKEYCTYGQLLDSSSNRSKENIVNVFSVELYTKIINDIFDDILLYNISFEIGNQYDLIIKNNNSEITKFDLSKIFNEVSFINCIIKLVQYVYKKNDTEVNLITNNDLINLFNISLNMINKKIKLTNNINHSYYNYFNYFKLIKKCKLLGYTKNQIIQFILRFKILGDKIQAMEAKSKCYLKNVYDSSDEDIKFNKRVLTTEDRMLLGLSLMESDVSFISKMTIKGVYVLFWNFIF